MATHPAICIRRVGPDCAEAFRALRLEALTSVPEAFGSSPEEETARPMDLVRARLDPSIPDAVFGAFADDDLVGMAGFALSRGIKKCHKGLLWGVFVRAPWRDRGTGEQLVRAVIDHARKHVLLLQASVVTTNAAARGIYHRLGFVCYGTERRALLVGNTFHDEDLLVLDLSSASKDPTS
ncbi:MAG: GNAT family N-acetyltransferase [Rhodospirillales bacterium]|nr:GNAT family N-acetyltransferase [Rhodospirillales bacterium]